MAEMTGSDVKGLIANKEMINILRQTFDATVLDQSVLGHTRETPSPETKPNNP